MFFRFCLYIFAYLTSFALVMELLTFCQPQVNEIIINLCTFLSEKNAFYLQIKKKNNFVGLEPRDTNKRIINSYHNFNEIKVIHFENDFEIFPLFFLLFYSLTTFLCMFALPLKSAPKFTGFIWMFHILRFKVRMLFKLAKQISIELNQ